MDVEVIATEDLGDRSYVAHDGRAAVVVDPQRDLDRIEALLERLGLDVHLVLETHIHNDYVTGGYHLARRTGAHYVVNAADPVSFERTGARDGDSFAAGDLRVEVVAAPGHTDTHLAYVISDAAVPEQPPVVFTGGSLLYGSVGRTDLVDPDRTRELTRAQYRTARLLAETLPDATCVFPTHGFGSFCSSGSTAAGDAATAGSTIGDEKARNDALTIDDEDKFVDTLIANLTAYPAYYAHMAPLNRTGPAAANLNRAPAGVDPAELGRRLAAGEWVIDLRSRTAYAADHLAGAVGIELGSQFATYVGWLLPWGSELTLLGESPEQVAAAQRQLARIGIDDLAAAAGGLADVGGHHPRSSFPWTDFAGARAALGAGDVLLDVRRADEYRDGHIEHAVNVPIHDLLTRLADVPPGRVWVHCASGFRAGIAAGLLKRAGRDVVLIDDDFEQVRPAAWDWGAPGR